MRSLGRKTYLYKEKPSPSGVTVMSSKMEETEAKEASNNIGDRHSRIPDTESNRKFTMLIEVG